MTFYVLSFLLAIPSPIFFILNAEAWAVLSGLSGTRPWPLVALAIACGQLLTFSTLFFAGERWALRWPKLARALAKVDRAKLQARGIWLVAAGALFAIPPLTALSVLAPAAGIPYARFAAAAGLGRLLRFSLLAGVPNLFSAWFDASALPESLRALL